MTILMTGDGEVRSAVEAIRLRVADYLNKPFDLDELPDLRKRRQPEKNPAHPTPEGTKGTSHRLFSMEASAKEKSEKFSA